MGSVQGGQVPTPDARTHYYLMVQKMTPGNPDHAMAFVYVPLAIGFVVAIWEAYLMVTGK